MSLDKTLSDTYRRDLKLDRYEVENTLPEHFDEKYPRLLNFLQEYYKSLEGSDNPSSEIKELMSARDIVETKEEFLSFVSSELLLGKPYFESFNDKRSALQYSSLMYRSKGTEFSIKQFFRIFYSVDSEVQYGREETFYIGKPKNDTAVYRGVSRPERFFDITFPQGTVVVVSTSPSNQTTVLEEGLHYRIDYAQNKIVLLAHDDLDAPNSDGYLREGWELKIETSLREQSAIGVEVTDKRITDNKFYQLYGISVASPISVNIWEEAYKTFVHPAGMFLKGQVSINSLYRNQDQLPREEWQISDGLGSMPPAFIQPPPPLLIESSSRVMGNSGLGLHTSTRAEIGPGPNGYKVLSRINDQQSPHTVGGWHTQYESLSSADDINARTLDDTYADMSNTINLVDENVWHFDYLHPVDSDGAGNRTPIYGYND